MPRRAGPGAHPAFHLIALVLREVDRRTAVRTSSQQRHEVIGLQVGGESGDSARPGGSRGRCRVRCDASRSGRTRAACRGGDAHAPASLAIAAGRSWSGRISSARPASATARGHPVDTHSRPGGAGSPRQAQALRPEPEMTRTLSATVVSAPKRVDLGNPRIRGKEQADCHIIIRQHGPEQAFRASPRRPGTARHSPVIDARSRGSPCVLGVFAFAARFVVGGDDPSNQRMPDDLAGRDFSLLPVPSTPFRTREASARPELALTASQPGSDRR